MRHTLLLSLTFLAAGAALAAEPAVLLSSQAVRPGETLRVELDNVPPSSRFYLMFDKKRYPLYPVGPNAQRALIGVPLGASSGTRVGDIRPASAASSKPVASFEVLVASRDYATENVSFTSEKTALMKAEHRESALIHRHALRRTADQHWEGVFSPPVQGPTIGEFGLKRLRNGKIHAGFHKGVDLRAPQGTPVLAANAGVIEIAAPLKAHGKTILINHGQGVMSIYLHMSSLLVKPGDKVAKGQKIGKVGSTGLSTAPHVHWQVYVHGTPVDPASWLENDY